MKYILLLIMLVSCASVKDTHDTKRPRYQKFCPVCKRPI